ncbi:MULTISPECIES: hypothetical protein [Vibrio]|uniref:Uncharacterized protein n=1 Tax=Vibrio halioticoli NBRC 102217 TaxID=1219072 RepID=V5HK73_9VIBR|nr:MULTISPECIES: hypothetical protein [Vibrio]MPW37855.1 hypothetical protein [Vibrio sp. B1Z05]GAD89655.1 hypothetical protein VHA01S_024_00500 [Vibrio halioticoli NBRC 102217]
MPSELKKLDRRRKAQNHLDKISGHEEHVLVIHYSCESFYNRPEGQTPRVTSIAVRNYASGQTASFSIHKVAELKGVAFPDIDREYDKLEKEMLKEFYVFLEKHKNYDWVHWNMRDINYGFPALEHRFRVLKGKPVELDESRKFDLSRALVSIFGNKYIGHPRLIKLMEANHITALDLLDGPGEATAFENKEFVKLHQSTLRKVDVLANILGRVIDRSIKTNATWQDTHGVHPKIILEYITKHWIFSLLGSLISIGLGVYGIFF